MTKKYDIAVIGSGPGGYVAAIRAAQLGLKTVCIEKSPYLGGTCLNVGCIPSKCLLQSTEHYEFFSHDAEEHGIDCKDVKFSLKKMMERKSSVVDGFRQGVKGLFRKNKVDSVTGTGKLVSTHRIEVTADDGATSEVEAENIILATGSVPISLPFLPVDEKQIVTSTGALALSSVPKKMVVVGGGVIGVELASVYRRLGADVTVVEMLPMICPGMDADVSKGLLKALKQQGLKFLLSTQVESADVKKSKVSLKLKGSEDSTLDADVVLVGVGRKPFSDGLGLDSVGIELEKGGFVPVDDQFRTQVPNIFAIGDLVSGPMLAHRASEEGVAAVEIIAGKKPQVNYMAIPNVIYTHPEAASVGLSEEEAKELGCHVKTGTFPFRGNSRARCSGYVDGFVKVIEDSRTGHLIGVHIVGAHAGELIQEGMLAIQQKTTVAEMAAACHAHPTLSEALKEAALAVHGEAIHM